MLASPNPASWALCTFPSREETSPRCSKTALGSLASTCLHLFGSMIFFKIICIIYLASNPDYSNFRDLPGCCRLQVRIIVPVNSHKFENTKWEIQVYALLLHKMPTLSACVKARPGLMLLHPDIWSISFCRISTSIVHCRGKPNSFRQSRVVESEFSFGPQLAKMLPLKEQINKHYVTVTYCYILLHIVTYCYYSQSQSIHLPFQFFDLTF